MYGDTNDDTGLEKGITTYKTCEDFNHIFSSMWTVQTCSVSNISSCNSQGSPLIPCCSSVIESMWEKERQKKSQLFVNKRLQFAV